MAAVVTLAMNPTIDASYEVERIVAALKVRSLAETCDPGGGGINVARVLARLGGFVRTVYLSGGPTGAALDGMLDLHQLVHDRIAIAGDTRLSTTVFERCSGQEFRFVARGPVVAEPEWRACLDHLEALKCETIIASGSLPQGVPDDFYARVGAIAGRKGARFVLDSSGSALKRAIEAGGIDLVKPSRAELIEFAGHPLPTVADLANAARQIVAAGQARLVAVTLGPDGAILADTDHAVHCPALRVEARSGVGAGDSFLAAMTFALDAGRPVEEAFRIAIAAGAAAVLHPGTGLCHPDDLTRLTPDALALKASVVG